MENIRNVMSGADRGAGAKALRLAASLAEPFYAGVTWLRNRLFDAGAITSHSLGRPTISVGNITAGGTGKTPMVRWLAGRLRADGRRIAILARGYRSAGSAQGDEQRMLDSALNANDQPRVQLIANPNRVASAARALAADPSIDLFLLDDAFQHRRARRDLDIVLLSAPDPFGFGRMLPRGLLRESLGGLRRAGACVLTHCDQVDAQQLNLLEQQVRRYHEDVPIYRTVHAHVALNGNQGIGRKNMSWLGETPFFAFAGIGSPERLDIQLRRCGASYRGNRWFPDHYSYSERDLSELQSAARRLGADVLITTEKDWVKLAEFPVAHDALPTLRIEMAMQFIGDDESLLWKQISKMLASPLTA